MIIHRTVRIRDSKYKYMLFSCISILHLSLMYIWDFPCAIQRFLQTNPLNMSSLDFNLLYVASSVPGFIISIFTGTFNQIFDPLGLQMKAFICIFIGQMIFVYGLSDFSLVNLLIGRLLLGIGGEVLFILGGMLLEDWFSQYENQKILAFTFFFIISKLGTSLSLNLAAIFSDKDRDFGVTSFLSLFFATTAGVMTLLIKYADRMYIQREKHFELVESKVPLIFRREITQDTSCCSIMTEEKLTTFDKTFWKTLFLFVSSLSCYYVFMTNSLEILFSKMNNMSPLKASLCFLTSQIVSFVSTAGLDNYIAVHGNGFFYLGASILLWIFGLLIVSLNLMSPVNGILVFGLAYGLFCSTFWRVINKIVSHDQSLVCNGSLSGVLNLSLIINHLAFGYLADLQEKRGSLCYLFLIFVLSLSLCVYYSLYKYNKINNSLFDLKDGESTFHSVHSNQYS